MGSTSIAITRSKTVPFHEMIAEQQSAIGIASL
jgi:hypothetical protein